MLCPIVPLSLSLPHKAGESHVEKVCAEEAVSSRVRPPHGGAVLVSIPVRSRSDSPSWHRRPHVASAQAMDTTLEFPHAIALPHKGGGNAVALLCTAAGQHSRTCMYVGP